MQKEGREDMVVVILLSTVNTVNRALREFQTKDAMVAKLFAKHIKLDEAIKTVQKSR